MKQSMFCATPSILCGMALTLCLSGSAFAADLPQSPTQPTMTPQPSQPGPTEQSRPSNSQSGQDQSGQEGTARKDRDYQAAVKQCDNSTDRDRCVDAVKRKFGQM